MNDAIGPKPGGDFFDDLLRATLHARASASPRDGLTNRVLAYVDAGKGNKRWLRWLWLVGPVVAILLVVVVSQIATNVRQSAGSLTRGQRPSFQIGSLGGSPAAVLRLPSVPPVVVSAPPARLRREQSASAVLIGRSEIPTTTSKSSVAQALSSAQDAPKLDTFPSHGPTTEVAFGTGPALALPSPSPQAAEQVQLLRAEQALPLTIARLQIAPITLPSGERQ